MSYRPYLSLSIHHDFYRQSTCFDLGLEPSQACQRWMDGHRLVAKPKGSGLQLGYAATDDQRPLVAIKSGQILTFLLTLKNPGFTSFTQLDAGYQPGSSFYIFSNESIEDANDLHLRSQVIQFQDMRSTDPSALLSRCAAITELHTLKRSEIFGIVEIHHRERFQDFTRQAPEFKIAFAPRERPWSYYLIADQALDPDVFSIRDQSGEVRQHALSFSRVESDASDRIIASIQQQFPDSQTLVFQSDMPVPCQDQGRAHLQLMKRGHNAAWVPHLPNPPNDHGVQIINLLTDV